MSDTKPFLTVGDVVVDTLVRKKDVSTMMTVHNHPNISNFRIDIAIGLVDNDRKIEIYATTSFPDYANTEGTHRCCSGYLRKDDNIADAVRHLLTEYITDAKFVDLIGEKKKKFFDLTEELLQPSEEQ